MIERIRQQMIKNPSSELWNKDKNKWTKEEYQKFYDMEKGITMYIKDRGRNYGSNAIKVIRISDGFIYDSITDCQNENDINNTNMYQMLKEETKYKRA